MDKIEDDIDKDREGMDQGRYKPNIALVNGWCSSILNILFLRV